MSPSQPNKMKMLFALRFALPAWIGISTLSTAVKGFHVHGATSRPLARQWTQLRLHSSHDDEGKLPFLVSGWLPAAFLATATLLPPNLPLLRANAALPTTSITETIIVKERVSMDSPMATSLGTSGTAAPRIHDRATMSKSVLTLQSPRTGPIMDMAQLLSTEERLSILQSLQRAEEQTGTEIQVILVNQIDLSNEMTPKQMATKLFNQWGIGLAKKNNGVLILAVMDQRRIEIEVGSGVDTWLTADWCTQTLQETAVPQFRQGRYGRGILQTVERVAERLVSWETQQVVVVTKEPARDAPSASTCFAVGVWIVWFIGYIDWGRTPSSPRVRSRRKNKKKNKKTKRRASTSRSSYSSGWSSGGGSSDWGNGSSWSDGGSSDGGGGGADW